MTAPDFTPIVVLAVIGLAAITLLLAAALGLAGYLLYQWIF